jgi:hypothetical protein
MEGQAPQGVEKISSQLLTRKEATWRRKKMEGQVRRDEEGPLCTERAFLKKAFIDCDFVQYC